MPILSVNTCHKCGAAADIAASQSFDDHATKKLYRYDDCGHVMCFPCLRGIGVDTSKMVAFVSVPESGEETSSREEKIRRIPLNAECPVCQRQSILFPLNGKEGVFPPYLKKFAIVKKAMEEQVPKFCHSCPESDMPQRPTGQCLDCEQYLCDKCYESHGKDVDMKHRLFRLEELKRESLFKSFNMKLVRLDDPMFCQRHPGKTLESWCSCEVGLCVQCKRYHIEHEKKPFENHLRDIAHEIEEERHAAEDRRRKLDDAKESHDYKKASLQELSRNVKEAIRNVAEKKKARIEADANRLLLDVDLFVREFKANSDMLDEIITVEEMSFDIFSKILNTMSDDDGEVADEYLLDYHDFLKENGDVILKQTDVVLQICDGAEELRNRVIEFQEQTDADIGNQVGTVTSQVSSSRAVSSPTSSTSEDASELTPLTNSFDDLDPDLFSIAETELWKSQQIDKGPFTTVYKGVYKTTGFNSVVAIKELNPNATKQQLESFMNEVNMMRDLDHENIVRMFGLCKSRSLLLAMDFASKGSVGKYLKHHPETPVVDLYDILYHVSRGMKHLEEKRLVHRCLTARTIYLYGPNVAKIGSFGMAKYLDTKEDYFTEKATRLFPLKWYPPEAIYKFHFDAKSDVWSFGVVMWEVFSFGAKPYQNMKGPDILTMLDIGERLPRPERCPRICYEVMRPCWETRRRDRPNFEQLEHEIKGLLQTEISATSPVYQNLDCDYEEASSQ